MAGYRQSFHLMGVGGTGMSALAQLLRSEGHEVTGCDLKSNEATAHLRSLGIAVTQGHDPAHVAGTDVLVVSSAIPPDHPERLAAARQGIVVRHRASVLAELMETRHLVAVAGAHGKTTVTGLISHLFSSAGLDPMAAVGFALPGAPAGARSGGGQWAIAEVDESDHSFLAFHPDVAVVTVVEPDHLENYDGRFEELVDAYVAFLEGTRPGSEWILGVDSPVVRDMIEGRPVGTGRRVHAAGHRIVTYALDAPAQWRAAEVRLEGRRSAFVALKEGRAVAEVRLSIPGRHNVANALAALAAGESAGIDVGKAARLLESFAGARRRFEVLFDRHLAGDAAEPHEGGRVMVVDDYAHHPTEIAAVIRAAREGYPGQRIVAVFQPHRYHRTAALMDELAASFDQVDALILTEIYAPPPESPIEGITGRHLFERILRRHAWQGRPQSARFRASLAAALDAAVDEARPGSLLLVMGAGNVTGLAHDLARILAEGCVRT